MMVNNLCVSINESFFLLAEIMAKKQIEKQRLSMAGEYGVCAELSKRGCDVSISLGNSKAVDIFLFKQDGTIVKRIEVKTSRSSKFVTGFFQKYYDKSHRNHPDFWVLVHIDSNNISHYYILTHEEMGDVQMKRNKMDVWGKVEKGCDNVLQREVKLFEDMWDKIVI